MSDDATTEPTGTPLPPPMQGPPPIVPPQVDGPPPMDGPPADGPRTAARAYHHVTESTKTYPCEACGGELKFHIASQQLRCEHCGSSFELGNVDAPVGERDLRQALMLVRHGRVASTQSFLGTEKEIVCQNCGGHTTFTGSLTANSCPYCLTPIQRDDVHDAPERLPVDGVVPFTVDEKQAKELIDKWINSRWFAPSEFKQYGRSGSFTSVYTAYFTYDAETTTAYRGERGDDYTVKVGSGDNERTETRTRWSSVSGTVGNSFDDVTVFANEGFEPPRIKALEPWPTGTAKPYSAEYVAGHLCRTYDHDVEECLDDATDTMTAEIRSTVERSIGGDKQRIHDMDIAWRAMTYKHLLMPIWLLTVMYMDRPFQVYINGVTGEVQGSRPYSKVKIITAIVAALAIIIGLLVLWSSVRSGGG